MGLTSWSKSPNGKIIQSDVVIAKNYLKEKEIKLLNTLVDGFLTLAENRAMRNSYKYGRLEKCVRQLYYFK